MGEPVQSEQYNPCDSLIVTHVPPTRLPPSFLTALEGREELLISSREEDRVGSVRAWFVVGPPGVVYLFADASSRRARRWRLDPWTRLTIPGTETSHQGTVAFVTPAEIDPELCELVVERWGMWGAATPEGLKRMLRDGSHVLLRVAGDQPLVNFPLLDSTGPR